MKKLFLVKERLAIFHQQLGQLFGEKKWLWGVVAGIVVSVAITIYVAGSMRDQARPTANLAPPTLHDSQTLPSDSTELTTLTVLLLGYGGPGHEGGSLSDVIQVARLDFAKGLLILVSIPRDSWVVLPSGTQNKINAAYSLDLQNKDPKATIAKQMAQVVTGFPIDYYLAVDFVGFQRLIGQELGGIDIKVGQTLTDDWYPIKGEELNLCGKSPEEMVEIHAKFSGFDLEKQFACRYEKIYFPAGVNHLQGGEVLKYVRSRHGSPGGDFARGIRQQEVLEAIREKLFSLEGISDLPKAFQKFASHLNTDLDAKLADYLWPALKGSRSYQTIKINLSTENVLTGGTASNGASIVQPRESWPAVQQYVQDQLTKN